MQPAPATNADPDHEASDRRGLTDRPGGRRLRRHLGPIRRRRPCPLVRDAVTAAGDAELDQLTPRETEAMRHIAPGFTCNETAKRRTISVKTGETHVSSVLRKLQLSNRHAPTAQAAHRTVL